MFIFVGMRPINLTGLSKTISHALRHAPGEYGLTLDAEGWVLIEDLLRGLKGRRWDVEATHIHQVIDQAEKKRFQIVDGRIRAYYGHSTDTRIVKQPQEPPVLLYHGTVMSSYDSIMQHGLKPMERQYVHLSADVPTAQMVAGRRPGPHVIFTISAKAAYDSGVQFYGEENGIWLADEVPVEYVTPNP